MASVPVKISNLSAWLTSYAVVNTFDAQLLFQGFSEGFNLQYTGPPGPRDANNLKSAVQLPYVVLEKLNKEISLGRICGPFDSPPFPDMIVSPIGLVDKKVSSESVDLADHYRLIHHLSHPEGMSINDFIPQEHSSVTYTKFDEAITMVQKLGKGAQLAKFNIKSAFRLIPVRPADFHLLGIKFQGKYFFDRCLPFGCRISCASFEKFSTFLEWCIIKKTNSHYVIHYLDDFLLGGTPSSNHCSHVLQVSIDLFKQFGVPIATEKTVPPSTNITFLGLTIDTLTMEVRIPADKITAVTQQIQSFLTSNRKKVRVVEFQSLVGRLQFITRAIPAGRAFCRRLYDAISGQVKPYHRVRVSRGVKEDLKVWLQFLTNHNGVSVFQNEVWLSSSQMELFTDAASSCGFGVYFQGSWAYGKWPGDWVRRDYIKDMTFLELFPVVVALRLWAHTFQNRKVIFVCDNQAVVSIINRQTSKNRRVMSLVRFMVTLCLKHNILFRSRHISSHDNVIADAISRFQWDRFREAAPRAETEATPLPPDIWDIWDI